MLACLLTHHGSDVDCLGVGHGDRRISVHEQHGYGDADDVGTPENDRSLPRDLHPVSVKELDAPLTRSFPRQKKEKKKEKGKKKREKTNKQKSLFHTGHENKREHETLYCNKKHPQLFVEGSTCDMPLEPVPV